MKNIKKLATALSLVIVCSMSACSTVGSTPTTKDNGSTAEESKKEENTSGIQIEKTEGKEGKKYTIAVVPKLTTLSWYERMEEGVKEYAADNNVDAFFTGPSEADGALQAQCIEDLISQGVDAICCVPFSTESLEPVFKKAREAGIVVITHEGATMENIDYDIEAFNNEEYGTHLMKILGEATGGSGEYIQTVGALTSASHLEWTTAAQKYQEEKYPDMKRYGDLIETSDDQSVAYNKVKEALTAKPDIKAIQGSAMPDVAGAALAVEELGLGGKVKIAGTALVSNAGQYVKDGTIETISFWDPALAGKALVDLAVKILDGEEVKDGIDLGAEGYTSMKLDGKVLTGAAWIDVNKDNVDDPKYDF